MKKLLLITASVIVLSGTSAFATPKAPPPPPPPPPNFNHNFSAFVQGGAGNTAVITQGGYFNSNTVIGGQFGYGNLLEIIQD
jgi:hypothetical protein